jgi:tyrosyl-DNA phosphodiesterase-1
VRSRIFEAPREASLFDPFSIMPYRMLRLVYPDNTISPPLEESLSLGRGPVLQDPYISRSYAVIEPLLSSPPSLMITSKSTNSIIVEEKLGETHVVKCLLEKNESLQLQEGDAFYVSGRKETTTIQVIAGGVQQVHGKMTEGQAAKRRRLDAGPARANLPSPFSLMGIRRSEEASSGHCGDLGVTLNDLCPASLGPNIKLLCTVLSNYQFDLSYLYLHHCPALFKADHMIVLHGGRMGGNDSERMRDECLLLNLDLRKITIHAPPVKDYGTHHSKFILLFYSDQEGKGIGMRVIISSANFIRPDLEGKTQSIWYQDFPPALNPTNSNVDGGFGADLDRYLSRTGLQNLPGLDPSLDVSRMILSNDFSSARAHLIGSVPGWHEGDQWGHLKLRKHLQSLQSAQGDGSQGQGRIVLQYTSIGRLDANWLFKEIGLSLSGGLQHYSSNLSSTFRLIWPTFIQVRESFRGWASGSSIPGSLENITRDFLRPLYSKWDGHQLGRADVMPHMKSYAKFSPNGQQIDWIVTGSHNLSKVAWGMMSKEGKLGMQSFELSVLLHPSLEEHYLCHPHFGFQVVPLQKEALRASQAVKEAREAVLAITASPQVAFWPLSRAQEGSQASSGTLKYFPLLPYDHDPEPYAREDRPWCREQEFEGYDTQGLTWKEVFHMPCH